MSVEIKISYKRNRDFHALAEALNRRVPQAIKYTLAQLVDDALNMMELRAKQLVPVRTGHLQSMISTIKFGELTGALIADADYAGFVEFGTRFMQARPYMRPAFELSLPEMIEQLRQRLPQKIKEEIEK